MHRILIPFFLLLLMDCASAGPIDAFLKRVEGVKSFKVCFTQKSKVDPIQDSYDVYEGSLTFLKPLKFRWTYTVNSTATVICNGKSIYTYFPEQKQLNVSKVDNSTEIFPLVSMLSSEREFRKFYTVSAFKKGRGGFEYVIEPKLKTSMFRSIAFVLGKDLIPKRVVTFGVDGSENVYEITCWKENVPVDPSIFSFVPERGVQIIRY